MTVFDFPELTQGRDYDLLVFRTDQPKVMTRVDQTLFRGDGGQATTGVQKLAQQVTLRLFTKLDGRKYEPFEGCRLVSDILSGLVRTENAAQGSFAHSRESLFDQFIRDFQKGRPVPADEQLQDIELLDVQIDGDLIYFRLKVTSRAGNSAVFIAPIAI